MIDLSNSTINELIMSVGIMTGVIAFFFFTVAHIFITRLAHHKNIGSYTVSTLFFNISEMALTILMIMLFQFIYQNISAFWYQTPFAFAYSRYQPLLQLLLIFASIWGLSLLSKQYIGNTLGIKQKSYLRLSASVYTLLLLVLWRNHFSSEMIYNYFILLLGRFIYFDTIEENIKELFASLFHHLHEIILLLAYTHFIFSQLSQELITNIGGDYLLPVIAIYSGMLIGLKVFSNIAVDFF